MCGWSWAQFCWIVVETDGGNAELPNPCQTSRHRQNSLPVCCFGLCSNGDSGTICGPQTIPLYELSSKFVAGIPHCYYFSGGRALDVMLRAGVSFKHRLRHSGTVRAAPTLGWKSDLPRRDLWRCLSQWLRWAPETRLRSIQFPWRMSPRHQLREKGILFFPEWPQAPTVTKGLSIQNC